MDLNEYGRPSSSLGARRLNEFTKADWVARFEEQPLQVAPDQPLTLDRLRPGDELGVARLYHAVYGCDYPFDDYYVPGRILALNQALQLCSVVCRTAEGAIVGHGALYRGSAPFAGLYEIGQYLVLPGYRRRGIADLIDAYIHGTLAGQIPADALYGEAVTNHTVTQTFDLQAGMTDYALELSLLPPGQGRAGASGRVACLVQSKTLRDRPHRVHLPAPYREDLEFLLADRDFQRDFAPASSRPPDTDETVWQVQRFPGTGTSRWLFPTLGRDFPRRLRELEATAQAEGSLTLQVFLNLGQETLGLVVDHLRQAGWILGGYLPRWFDSDGLLLQKIQDPPDFAAIQLCSDKARGLLKRVQAEFLRLR